MGNQHKDGDSAEPAWDWITLAVAFVIAVILAALTMELWLPHFGPD
jgi:hypothetical protein